MREMTSTDVIVQRNKTVLMPDVIIRIVVLQDAVKLQGMMTVKKQELQRSKVR